LFDTAAGGAPASKNSYRLRAGAHRVSHQRACSPVGQEEAVCIKQQMFVRRTLQWLPMSRSRHLTLSQTSSHPACFNSGRHDFARRWPCCPARTLSCPGLPLRVLEAASGPKPQFRSATLRIGMMSPIIQLTPVCINVNALSNCQERSAQCRAGVSERVGHLFKAAL
jgi:hypothetical protein